MEEVTGPEPEGPSESTALLSSSVPVTCSPVVQQDLHSHLRIQSCFISELYKWVLKKNEENVLYNSFSIKKTVQDNFF